MTSVENLYWILYENLLKPVGMDAWYFYPFGTKNHLSKFEFLSEVRSNQMPHALFHFDQEPIFNNQSWNDYDRAYREYWSGKIFRMLANSEYSDVKKRTCRDRYMQDWYFFYHGLAALDWFRDAEYITSTGSFVSKFSSYNHHVSGKRSYRMALTARLLELGLHDQSDISFHGTVQDCVTEIDSPDSELTADQKLSIKEHLCDPGQLPMILDKVPVDSNHSAHFGHGEYRLWQRSFLHVVNETVFYDSKLHLTEKIFKPIVALRPFLLVGAQGNLAYLRRYGFQTFADWIDESYDDECDPVRRIDLVAHELQKLHKRPITELCKIYDEMLPVLLHNKHHFFGQFREIIVDELLENFDSCIRIWNNGRVDGRDIPTHPDLGAVKKILLGKFSAGI